MELSLYLGLVTLAVALGFKRYWRINPRIFSILMLLVGASASAVIRLKGFDDDIHVYAAQMSSSSTSFYYMREAVFWVSQRAVYRVLGNTTAAFIAFDVFTYFLVITAFNRLRMPHYAYVAFLVFFPVVLGMQNVYRQWVASCIMIYALTIVRSQPKIGWVTLILAAFTHNMSAIFAGPILFATRMRSSIKYLGVIAAFLLIIPALIIGSETKSSSDSGANLAAIYAGLVAIVALACTWVLANKQISVSGLVLTALYLAVTTAASVFLLSPAGAERIAMFALTILFPFLIIAIELKTTGFLRLILRLSIPIATFAPVLLFGTRIFILGEPVPDI